ncbi:MAG: CHAD domain-containing protein [Synechococcales bacterium]|nr:CHAD domain-containing protein [Synechococcales bacterium]
MTSQSHPLSTPANVRVVHHGAISLGQCARNALKAHFKKAIKHESGVLKDVDPEAIHQMRVGLRRLRSTMRTFSDLLELPKAIQESVVKKIAGVLGAVRDLDVLIDTLSDRYRPRLPKSERKCLDRFLKTLRSDRHQQFKKVKKLLKHRSYKDFKEGFEQWLEQPQCSGMGGFSVQAALPDVLLPPLSQVLLHPAWLAGDRFLNSPIELDSLNRWLKTEGEVLHGLRKQMKQMRYQAEEFAEFYGSEYQQQATEFKQIQELLGQLQDCWILDQALTKGVGDRWFRKLPTLAAELRQERVDLWRDWLPLRQKYLTGEFREHLRSLISHPV